MNLGTYDGATGNLDQPRICSEFEFCSLWRRRHLRFTSDTGSRCFFRSELLDKDQVRAAFDFIDGAAVLQDTPDTLVVLAEMPSGPVKILFFGGSGFGRVNDPLRTHDRILLVASLDDLMAAKSKATLDRAEAKDYRDIAEMISAGVSLPAGVSAFSAMFNGEPSQVLRSSAISRMEIWTDPLGPIGNSCEMHGIESENCRTWL